MNLILRGWEAALDFLYPPLCVLCKERLARGERVVCSRCWARVERWDAEVPLEGARVVKPVHAAGLFAMADRGQPEEKDPLRGIVHHLKYRNKKSLAQRLGRMMAEAVERSPELDAVIPVPLHSARRRERGYNQSELLSAEVGQNLGLPVLKNALKRIKNTPSQTGLDREQRIQNVKGAFRARDSSTILGKRVLLVDDVTTTGATLEACGEALALAGAGKISAVVAAWAK